MKREKLRRSRRVIRRQTFTISKIGKHLKDIQKGGGQLELWFSAEDGPYNTFIIAIEPPSFIIIDWPFTKKESNPQTLEVVYGTEGAEHRFSAKVMGFSTHKNEPVMRISYPRTIEIQERRGSPRIITSGGKSITVEYINIAARKADLVNISEDGMAFLFDRETENLYPGQVIKDFTLRFPEGEIIKVNGSIVRTSPYQISAKKHIDICGIAFIQIAKEDQKKIRYYIDELEKISKIE